MEQVGSAEISSCMYSQLIFDKEAKCSQREKVAFQ